MKRFLFVLSIVGIVTGVFLKFTNPLITEYPEDSDEVLSLGNFGGRVLPSHEVSPGTFTIKRPWEEVKNWGEDGIITTHLFEKYHEGVHKEAILMRAWRPDPKTAGAFEYAETTLTLWEDLPYKANEISFESGAIVVTPIHRHRPVAFWTGVMIATTSALLLGLIFSPFAGWPDMSDDDEEF